MLSYIMGMGIGLLAIYWVSFWVKHSMIIKARELFAMSHLGNRTVGVSKLKTMNKNKRSYCVKIKRKFNQKIKNNWIRKAKL